MSKPIDVNNLRMLSAKVSNNNNASQLQQAASDSDENFEDVLAGILNTDQNDNNSPVTNETNALNETSSSKPEDQKSHMKPHGITTADVFDQA